MENLGLTVSVDQNDAPDSARVYVGLDIGSTTAKLTVIAHNRVLYESYERHYAQVREKALEMVRQAGDCLKGKTIYAAVSGSAGYGMANAAGIPFVQEVFATGEMVRLMEPDTGTVIELGGEDAKILFIEGGADQRMNGTCAGGTGAFIDQMATLLNVTPDELDALSLQCQRIYPIASRCGVFAKSDIQPLLNQGAAKEDIAASIYQAVVNQTIAGLAQGRAIAGKVMFLGGPLSFNRGLQKRFVETLRLPPEKAVFPAYARISVALGAAIYASRQQTHFDYDALIGALETAAAEKTSAQHLPPLFENDEELERFRARHAGADVQHAPEDYCGDGYLGIDCGSTTTKLTLITGDDRILYSYYSPNQGNPVEIIRQQLGEIYRRYGARVTIRGAAATGYGEELIRHAFHLDGGLVETMAHFTAARHFEARTDFILDIGGQDIKCFKVHNNAIDNIMLNEACSSGCGSFIETFARSMGYSAQEFSRLGLLAKAPVDLGSRCTVFMNSSVKQAQKDGAPVEDISAGLSMSVVKNALYKVIRARSAEELGQYIVVQGGTFLNDAVLRSFELEIGHDVIRPAIAGLMGAFGAALYARSLALESSSILTPEQLEHFTHTSKSAVCRRCTNHCSLTVNTFSDGERYISGNKCEKGSGKETSADDALPNLQRYKREKLEALMEDTGSGKLCIGLPLALGMYELAPLWHGIFRALGFSVRLSGFSSRALYAKGQYSIPSDTACYPAKIMHGHIETLLDAGVDAIFYPCLTYNVDEKAGENHYNCPVVAYYSELLHSNMDRLKQSRFLYPYLDLNNPKHLARGLRQSLNEGLGLSLTMRETSRAVEQGIAAYEAWMADIRRAGEEAAAFARSHNRRVMILAGRPYHIDPEIGHGIDKLASSLGFVVLSEDSVPLERHVPVRVLNQWTYHARLYSAASYAASHDDTQLVQLVSFGCGIDAITTDEVRSILERSGKLYTQIKIDEITNLGAVNIRLRSLLGALTLAEKNAREMK